MKILIKIKRKIKNHFINKNINNFINKNKDLKLPVRESDLKPEIIIPCYNHGKFIEYALQSVPKNVPVTVINDKSTDNSLEIILKLKNKFNFKLIDNEINLNMHGSLNKAISLSKNNLFIMLNADDALNKLTINTIMRLYSELPNIRLLGAGGITFRDNETLRFDSTLTESLSYLPNYKIYGPQNATKYKRMNDINMTMSGCSFSKICVGICWRIFTI
jgi:glycosyltransferase involved in cell wall biosynthesis